MPIRLREWIQREWYNAGRDAYRAVGDFKDLSSLLPTPNRWELKRAPSWAGQDTFPSGFDTCKGAFYDHANQKVVFLGQTTADNYLATANATLPAWTMAGPNTIVASALTTGGLDGFNIAYWGGDLYVIASNSYVYRGSNYSAACAAFYSTADAKALCPAGDRMYLALTSGDILRLNDADNAFESYFTAIADLDIRFIAPYRGYLLVVTRTLTGTLQIHRLPTDASSPKLDTMATVPAATADDQLSGLQGTNLFAMYDDMLWLSPGRDDLLDGTKGLNVYTFQGSYLELKCQTPLTTASPTHFGFLAWRDHLLLYDLAAGAQTIRTWVGSDFTSCIPSNTATLPTYSSLYNAGGELLFCTVAAANEGITRLSASALSDGYLVTPLLTMEAPGLQKRLEQITVILDSKASGFKIPIQYDVDDTGSWTTAATANNTTRAVATAINKRFYTLKVRIDLDDDTAANKDIRIQQLSVLYSVDT